VAVVLGAGLLGLVSYVGLVRAQGSLSTPVDTTSDFSAPTKIAESLFTTYLLPFQIAGIILLAAVVGVVVLHGRQANRTRE
jgi:NADH-quinone oxidoreductase subunit J